MRFLWDLQLEISFRLVNMGLKPKAVIDQARDKNCRIIIILRALESTGVD